MNAFAADGWHCIAPDMRGYGRSSAPTLDSAYNNEQVGMDVAELHEHVCGKPAIWIGHDGVGRISQAVLFVNGELGAINTINGNHYGDPMRATCPDLTVEDLSGAHWLPLECKADSLKPYAPGFIANCCDAEVN